MARIIFSATRGSIAFVGIGQSLAEAKQALIDNFNEWLADKPLSDRAHAHANELIAEHGIDGYLLAKGYGLRIEPLTI